NATARFFGIGSQTSPAQETNYTDRELLGHITTGFYVGPAQRVLWTERIRNVEIQPAVVPDLPFTQSLLPAVHGTGGGTVSGDEVPFFERSSLGGQNTLRAFGVGRFVDNHSLVFNFEERIQLFHLRIFGTIAEVETAPFLDIGKVTNSFRYRAFSQYEANPGIGFRAISRPNVVGRVDFASGNEVQTVFAGLDFPF